MLGAIEVLFFLKSDSQSEPWNGLFGLRNNNGDRDRTTPVPGISGFSGSKAGRREKENKGRESKILHEELRTAGNLGSGPKTNESAKTKTKIGKGGLARNAVYSGSLH